ncbi:helix-turn-helix domain-containing protein [Tsukamurella strandjordii]|uniref:Helix-turn-helix transcriptional regulator n=1 Tax=Tsukamurella strandjordii TaxID=147577 RepID=A0AA90NCD7_9ACTN|nr:helix-turn-helix transcriptional regulator [Tsukamurella strandjordii]MDP0397857.1 helix-turn-helix transcriptional regulator [Tsukamurella strandjordii]
MEFRYVRGLAEPGVARTVAYDIGGVLPGTHLAVPSPALTLIVDLGDGLDLTGPGLDGRTSFRVCISGMHHAPYLVHHEGLQRGVQVDLPPSLVRALTGAPAAELGGEAIELTDLHPELAAELAGRVGAAAPADRARVAAGVLARHASTARQVQPDAAAAWAHLARHRGAVTVADLTQRSGWSARYLAMKFSAEFGMSIKAAARLMRFDAARRDLEAGGRPAEIAARRGFSDQAHLSREVRDFLGMTPSAYLALREGEFAAV